MQITTNFTGANVILHKVTPERVEFSADLRDTVGDWFYWAFKVEGAAGTTVTFSCDRNWIGAHGAAVSYDLVNWHWAEPEETAIRKPSFTYTFREDEDCVYFAHDILYLPSYFYRFCEKNGIPVRSLGPDRRGTPIPYVKVGEGEHQLLLTARHHCCESTGNYVMEGILEEYLRDPMPGWSILAVPFVDADGVMAGDQGKNRAPHDHNRDYIQDLYPGVRGVKRLVNEHHVRAAFDLHAPWHCWQETCQTDAHCYIVMPLAEKVEEYKRFSAFLAEECGDGSLSHFTEHDILPNTGWNVHPLPETCSGWCSRYPGIEIAFAFETTYFGGYGDIATADSMRKTGRALLRAAKRYFA